jgi:hypothetical protein
MSWQQISTPSDFPTVTVYRTTGASGRPIYSVTFRNKEFRGLGPAYVVVTGGLALMLLGILSPFFGIDPERGVIMVPVGMGLMTFGVWWTLSYVARRSIELDFEQGQFRVKKGNKVTLRKPLMLRNIAIEAHPDAEREHIKEKGNLGRAQKQHSLFGYFGQVGADRTLIVSRYEWPRQFSLMEVQQAVIWAIEQGAREMAGSMQADALPGRAEVPSLAPPLD